MKVDGRGGSRKCANVVPRVKGFAGSSPRPMPLLAPINHRALTQPQLRGLAIALPNIAF